MDKTKTITSLTAHANNACNFSRDIKLRKRERFLTIANDEKMGSTSVRDQDLNISHTAAEALRDALVELYPLPQPKVELPTAEDLAPVEKKAKTWKGKQAYKGNGKHTWEIVNKTNGTKTLRLRVPGGWLYTVDDKQNLTITTTFVPMPDISGSYPI